MRRFANTVVGSAGKRAVAVVEQHAHKLRSPTSFDNIDVAIAVEIGQRHVMGVGSGRIVDGRRKDSTSQIHEDAYSARILIGRHQID